MDSKERLILAGIIGAQLGPALTAWGVPKPYQPEVVGYVVAGIPIAYHLLSIYLPRILARLFPPVPNLPGPTAPKA